MPTGGAGEMLRSRLKIMPSFFLHPAKSVDFDKTLPKCDKVEKIELGSQIQVQSTLQKVISVLHGTIVKKEVNGKKIIAIFSQAYVNLHVIAILHREDEEGFFLDVMSNSKTLAQSLHSELNSTLNESYTI
ncbi:hypothetical protein TRFO_24274 [Tritrichomonas foetus]|uniref:Uncharacterized protein n=1 Tax=Tritrichomonas foetus TaxID=1144522 RepID=A0A1J4KCU0_9EUKA|nr:hypothetical protein TRFO_24274 [Tritrichomonas foetus]|eukprot:OHT07462.1 hypothetical protein TRFO_24274 [Tritrichomonas foetus]